MSSSPKLRRQAARRGLSPPPSLLDRFLAFLSPFQKPADSVVAVPDAQDPGAAAVPKAAPKKRGRPPGSKNKPKPPPQTVPAESADPGPGNQPEQAPAVAPEPEPEPRHPVHLTPAQMRRVRQISQPAEPLRAAGRGVQHGRVSKATMMPLERRNEPQMLRSFWKQYPSYRVQPLLYKRYNELLEARALNEWLENRRIRKEGEEYTDAVGRLTDTVNRRLPQLRYAPARRAPRREGTWPRDGTLRSRESWAACSKESMEERRQYGFRVRPNYGQVLGYIQEGEPIGLELPKRNASVYLASHFYLDDFPPKLGGPERPADAPHPHQPRGGLRGRRPGLPRAAPSLGRPGR